MPQTILQTTEQISNFMSGVYLKMCLATIVSMFTSFIVGTSPDLMSLFFTGIIKYIVIFSPLAAIFLIGYLLEKNLSKFQIELLFYGFAALMGLSFATIFAVYSMTSIFSTFLSTAILFGIMSLYGYFTKNNLDSIGQFMFIGLIAIIIASIINIFIGSSTFSMVISGLAIIIFVGLTAYDTQKIRENYSHSDNIDKAQTQGALTLYLDFINMFIALLQFMGGKKE
jgi:FtsH-binding integral membrane protein